MTNNIDLYEEFAKGVQSFTLTRPADIANHFADTTLIHENQPDSPFYCESMTWRLLATLIKTIDSSDLYRHAALKKWISCIPTDQHLLEKIEQEQDIEDEIMDLFKKNRFTHVDVDEVPRKKQKIHTESTEENEEVYKTIYKKLRSNVLEPVSLDVHQNISLTYLINGYIQYQQMALANQKDKINQKERSIWKKSVLHELEDKSIGKYKRALFNVLAGKTNDLYDTMCNTWEDVIWVYLNARIEELIDKNESVNLVLSEEIVDSALSKDHIMERDDPRVLFHHIQVSLLSKNPQAIVKKIYHAYHHKQIKSHHPSLYISEDLEIRTQLLRFISTFILYGHEYLGWKETMYSAAFLSDYANLNAEPTTLRPVVIATYASKQSPQYQIQMYSHFLQGFDGDDQECAILLQLGREFDLYMHDILQYTHTHLFKKAIEQSSYTTANPQKEKIDFEIQGEITKSDTLFFRSVQWLTLDQNMCIEAFEAANLAIRYFLSVCKIYLAQHVFDLFSDTLIERMSVASQNKMRAFKILTEFDSHKKLVSLFTDFELWKQLLQSEPQDNGSVDDLLEINKWRDQVEKKTFELDHHFVQILQGHWLGEGSNETAHVSKATLREIYIPETIIRQHQLLLLSSGIIPKNKEKARKLVRYVTDTSTDVFKDIKAAHKTTIISDELAKSMPKY